MLARSTLLSFQPVMFQLGGLCGSLVIGFLAKTYFIPSAWTAAAVILLLSSVAYLLLMAPRLKASHEQSNCAQQPLQGP